MSLQHSIDKLMDTYGSQYFNSIAASFGGVKLPFLADKAELLQERKLSERHTVDGEALVADCGRAAARMLLCGTISTAQGAAARETLAALYAGGQGLLTVDGLCSMQALLSRYRLVPVEGRIRCELEFTEMGGEV